MELVGRATDGEGIRGRGRLTLVLILTVAVWLWVVPAAAAASGDIWVTGGDAPLTGDPAHQEEPVAEGGRAAWVDCRPDGSNCRIYIRPLAGDAPEVELTPGGQGQGRPDMDGSLAVWEQLVRLDGGGSGYRIYYCDVNACEAAPVSPVSGFQTEPVVSDGRIAWKDERAGAKQADIYMFDLATGAEQPVCTADGRQEQPDIEGDWVVWVDNRGGTFHYGKPTMNDIYALNLASGEERRITFDQGASVQANPRLGRSAAGGYRLVYEGDGIWLYDFQTGGTMRLAGEGSQPDIDGDIVVWRAADGNSVMLHDLSTGETQQLSTAGAGYFNPSVSGNQVVWGDERAGNRDIYRATLRDRAGRLAERYRPVLRMGGDEHFQPAPVEMLLQAPGSRLMKRDDPGFEPIANPDARELSSLAALPGLYLDLAGDAVAAGGGDPSISIDRDYVYQHYVGAYARHSKEFPRPVYARVVDGAPGSGVAIQYWICYYANDHPELFHEGDWELVQVDLDGDLQPWRADYSHHGGGSWRLWDQVEHSGPAGLQPVAYVAVGSHANYFRPGDRHYIKWPVAWDVATGDGETVSPEVTLLPPQEKAEGAFAWLGYEGRWGEYTGARVGVGFAGAAGFRDGADNPPVQGYWRDPFSWPGDDCDGCDDAAGGGTDLELTAGAAAEIHLYDSQGRHTGPDGSGGVDLQIPGSEYLRYPTPGRSSIIVHGGDAGGGYRAVVAGVAAGPCELILTVPDRKGGAVETLAYDSCTVGPGDSGDIRIDGTRDFTLMMESGGSGAAAPLPPRTINTTLVDFTAPSAVDDLAVEAVSAGAVTLSLTAPGDDGDYGTALAYDLRYAREPITDENWKDARPAGALPAPGGAGSAQYISVQGLDAGATYYFAIKAMDDFYAYGGISNVAEATTPAPVLTWAWSATYWANLADFQARILSIEYDVANRGNDTAVGVGITGSDSDVGGVALVSSVPLDVGNLAAGQRRTVCLKYSVPPAVMRFKTFTYASCMDGNGSIHRYPEVPG